MMNHFHESETLNPLDGVEEMLHDHDWEFVRPRHDELYLQVTGKRGTYQISFLWQEEFGALQFFCEYDMLLPDPHGPVVAKTLQTVNRTLWLGHFDIMPETRQPCFRHTSLLSGNPIDTTAANVRDLIDIGLSECERHYPLFSLLHQEKEIDETALAFATCETVGRA
ncbi:MAG: YbjN domain-containing protein [Alphaproteobacteria bacterium]|nr:YbjN domain-containing protein [Alphaproteobacteria bacterium]